MKAAVFFSLPIITSQTIDSAAKSSSQNTPSAASFLSHSYQVLYIEDNPENQRLMQEICSEFPEITLRCVSNAEEGFELACSNPPDLILMDINLPGMNGFQAKQLLQQNPLTAHIPVVAISASSTPSELQQAKTLGFINFYTKPYNLNILAQDIKQILIKQENA